MIRLTTIAAAIALSACSVLDNNLDDRRTTGSAVQVPDRYIYAPDAYLQGMGYSADTVWRRFMVGSALFFAPVGVQ